MLSAFSEMKGAETPRASTNAPPATAAPARGPRRSLLPSQSIPCSTRAAPMPPSTQAAAVAMIR